MRPLPVGILLATLALPLPSPLPAQVGAPAKRVSPEIVREMARQARTEDHTGLTVAQLREFKLLHDTDAELLHHLLTIDQATRKRFLELEDYIATLDISVDTRLLTEDHANIKALQIKEAERAASEKQDHDETHKVIMAIATGVIMLVIGGISAAIKVIVFDPKRRRALYLDLTKEADTRAASVVSEVKQVKTDVLEETRNIRDYQRFVAANRNRTATSGGTVPE